MSFICSRGSRTARAETLSPIPASSSGLGRLPLKQETRVQFSLRVPSHRICHEALNRNRYRQGCLFQLEIERKERLEREELERKEKARLKAERAAAKQLKQARVTAEAEKALLVELANKHGVKIEVQS